MSYDVHAHCIPQAFRDWLEHEGPAHGARVVAVGDGRGVEFAGRVTTASLYGLPALSDPGRRLDEMDRMGLDVQVLAGWVDLTGYEIDRDHVVAYSRAHNRALAEEAARGDGRFRSLGTAPLQFPDLAVDVMEHAMGELEMGGIQIATTVDGSPLDQVSGLDDFWRAAEELEAFILLHPMRPLPGVDLSRYLMDNAVGRPAESSVALAGLIFSGVLERFPGLRLCTVHGAGFIPYQIGRLDRAYHQQPDRAGERISRPPSEYLRMTYADTVVHDPRALAHLIAVMGADRVLVGSDYPFAMGDSDPMALLASVPGLDSGQVSAITSENARALLG